MKKATQILCSRLFIVGAAILVQIVWFLSFIFKFSEYSSIGHSFLFFLSVLAVLWLINKDDNPAYKLAWIIAILLFPVFGGLLYLLSGNKNPSKKLRKKLEASFYLSAPYLNQQEYIMEEIYKQDKNVYSQVNYISKTAGFPIYDNTSSTYFKSGEEAFEIIKERLKKAEHYIFLEYFIIDFGIMWNEILEILIDKVKKGVDVRLIYDDVGCVTLLPFNYNAQLEKLGIQCIAFNPFVPIFSLAMNNRDHRKILVIDGHTGFTGGFNLADEYINKKKRFGYWKDTGILIEGDGVFNLTNMFLQTWNGLRPTDSSYKLFHPGTYKKIKYAEDGFVQPYGDTPLDKECVGENVYLNIIFHAKEYVYLFTPYLVIDNEMMTALCLAAKRGVDVKIVTPGIPDKKSVFWLSKSYYRQLIEAGVNIYEYSPGFIHAKCFVCDDEIATVGTINMDYRSLYLHFECGIFLYKTSSIIKIKQDALETIKVSRKIELQDSKQKFPISLVQAVLRVFAPLM